MKRVRFRTNALLKSIIGKDLITDDNVAVLELVKNSFDAGSDYVEITYKNITKNTDIDNKKQPSIQSSKLIIADRGIGMSEYDITEKWLNIAYSDKKEKREEFGRVLAGNKGVGRFSCDRLGKFLTIYTRVKGEEYNKIFIDWTIFEKEGEIDFNIQDVEFTIEKLSEEEFTSSTDYEAFECGTLLEISNLREYWHPAKIISLKRQLERLINPNQAFKKNKFSIKITADEYLSYDKNKEDYNRINGTVKNKIFEKLDFKTSSIHSSIDEKGEFITTILQDRGNEIFVLKERNSYSQLRDINITVYYLNTYSKAYFTRQTGIKSVDFGSIFMFINGFRIPPYGDAGDDWLGMEVRKGQGHSRYLGTREVVGQIEITDNQEIFKIISNRTGVVNNVAFEQLTKSFSPFGYYYKTFRRLERFVVEGIKWDSVPKEITEGTILNENWDESKERYIEDSLTRNKRILSVIHKIIDAKKDEILKLDVNAEFIREIINQQTERAKIELENVVKSLSEKSQELNPELISDVLNKISKSSNDIRSLSKIMTNFSEANEKDLNELSLVENLYDEKSTEYTILEEKLRKEVEARKRAEEELELEKEKNTYLRTSTRSLNEDSKGLVHNIKITSKRISDSIDNLYDKILNSGLSEKQILKALGNIKFESEKALKISNIITRSNFRTDKNAQIVDIVKYLDQYIKVYSDIYPKNKLQFQLNDNGSKLIRKISILEISVIIDDLISNSEKAGAKLIQMDISNPSEDKLKILFSDDGKGVPEKFLNDKSKIFELGITTTNGSGIGLNLVQTALKSLKGEIKFIDNGIILKGACFEIIIN